MAETNPLAPTSAPTSAPTTIQLKLTEQQGIDLATEALRLTALMGRAVSATEVVRRRVFGYGGAAD